MEVVSNAFRHSGHHCHGAKAAKLGYVKLKSPMPFGIQGITAPSVIRARQEERRGVSNAFRHSGHHCLSSARMTPSWSSNPVSNAFRHSGHHCQFGKLALAKLGFPKSPMPFGIQGITAH